MSCRRLFFCLTAWFTATVLPLHGQNADSLRLEAIIGQAHEVSLAKSRNRLLHLLKEAAHDSVRFNTLSRLCEKRFNHGAADAACDSLCLICLHYGLNSKYLPAAQKQRHLLLAQQMMSGRRGHLASDFAFTARDGQSGNLYGIVSTVPVLLVFFDPYCQQCQTFISQTSQDKRFNDMIEGQKLRVIAINTSPDRPLWERIKNDLPPGWVAGQSSSEEIFNHYDLRSYPSVYLLGKDRRVIIHSADANLIFSTLKETGATQ